MDHKQLHAVMSEDLMKLRAGKITPKEAKEIFNGCGKIILNCRNELVAMGMGFDMDVPLLGIKAIESERVNTRKREIKDFDKQKKIKK